MSGSHMVNSVFRPAWALMSRLRYAYKAAIAAIAQIENVIALISENQLSIASAVEEQSAVDRGGSAGGLERTAAELQTVVRQFQVS